MALGHIFTLRQIDTLGNFILQPDMVDDKVIWRKESVLMGRFDRGIFCVIENRIGGGRGEDR